VLLLLRRDVFGGQVKCRLGISRGSRVRDRISNGIRSLVLFIPREGQVGATFSADCGDHRINSRGPITRKASSTFSAGKVWRAVAAVAFQVARLGLGR